MSGKKPTNTENTTEEKRMKHNQKELLKKYGLNPKKWTVVSENDTEIKAIGRYSGIVCILDKKRGADSE